MQHTKITPHGIGRHEGRPRLLIVEPDRLTRWSTAEYMHDAFDISVADSAPAARRLIDTNQFDALVISEDLPLQGSDTIEEYARRRNPGIRTVRTVTRIADPDFAIGDIVLIEKPFDLSALARALTA